MEFRSKPPQTLTGHQEPRVVRKFLWWPRTFADPRDPTVRVTRWLCYALIEERTWSSRWDSHGYILPEDEMIYRWAEYGFADPEGAKSPPEEL